MITISKYIHRKDKIFFPNNKDITYLRIYLKP